MLGQTVEEPSYEEGDEACGAADEERLRTSRQRALIDDSSPHDAIVKSLASINTSPTAQHSLA